MNFNKMNLYIIMLYSTVYIFYNIKQTKLQHFATTPPPRRREGGQFLGDSSRLPRIDSVKAIILNSIYSVVSVCLFVCSVTDSRQRISLDREHIMS